MNRKCKKNLQESRNRSVFLVDLCVQVIMKNRVKSMFFEVINSSTTSTCSII